mgnify:FL=1
MKHLNNKFYNFCILFILVGCGGGGGGSTPLELSVASFSEFKLAENSVSGAWTIDASTNKSTSISYSITGGPDSSYFSMSGNTLSFSGAADYEAPSDLNKDGVYEVYVQTSSGNSSSTQTVYVRLTDVPEPPKINTASINDVSENTNIIATISATDQDAGSSLVFSLLDSGGSKDEKLLSIDSSTGAITFTTAPDYEAPKDLNADNTIFFTVVVSDGSLSTQQDFTFAITNVNETPVVDASTTEFSIAESTTSVGTISASDQDSGSTISFSLATGDSAIDDGLFAIDSETGAISFLSPPNFESPGDKDADNIYNFTVIASDGSLSSSQAMSVTITDINEGPVFSSIASAQSYVENSGSTISVIASDVDSSSLSYTLSGADASKFIVSSSGVLSFVSGPDYEAPSDSGVNNIYNVSVEVSDGTNSSSVSLVITVSDDTSDNYGIRLPAKVALAELKKES